MNSMSFNDEEWTCFCGAPMEVVSVETWIDEKNAPGELTGIWSCPMPGCRGNAKEHFERRLVAMQKLTEEDMKVLGLWRYSEPGTPKPENLFMRWLRGLIHG